MVKDSNKQFELEVDESGRLVVPSAVAEKYGLKPDARIPVEDNANGLHLRRPATQLARIYIEPTTGTSRTICRSENAFRNSIFHHVFFAADASCSNQTRKIASAALCRPAAVVYGLKA